MAADDSTPEFLRVKNNLRRTLYEDDDAMAATGDLKGVKARSKSLGDLDEAKDLPEPDTPVPSKKGGAKKKGFLSSLFSKWFRSKSDIAGDSAAPAAAAPPDSKAKLPAVEAPAAADPAKGKPAPRVHAAQPQPAITTPAPPSLQSPAKTALQAKRLTTTLPNVAAAGKVVSIAVKSFKKVTGPKDDYVFTVEVVRESATYSLQKTFDDFFNFHTGLIFQFPEEAGRRSQKRTLPDLPLQTVFVSESMAGQRRMELDRYLKKLFQLPEKITASAYTLKFLDPKDPATVVAAPAAAPAAPKKGPTTAPAAPVGARPKPQVPRPRAPPALPSSKNPVAASKGLHS